MKQRLSLNPSLLLVLLLAGASMTAFGQKFYPDDPLQREPKPRDVGEPKLRKIADYYDNIRHHLATPGERQPESGPQVRAMNTNTMGEPMEGAWYTRRHYWKRMSIEELVRGPGNSNPPSETGPWTIISAKNEGITPGFVIKDSKGDTYFVKFDPPSNPEIATAAEQIGTRIFYAVGYHVPQNYLVRFRADRLKIGEDVIVRDQRGKERSMTRMDLKQILEKAPDVKGVYRANASLALDGKPIGPFRYYSVRRDDPNDIYPHEHHRELRGMHVFAAWLNHDDSRAVNTLDTVVEEGGVRYIRHHLVDFGSILGSGTDRPNSARGGGDYQFSWRRAAQSLFTLGLKVPYWARAEYSDLPSVGLLEYNVFNPEIWRPEYPNTAFLNRLPDDELWAARQVANFTDEELRAIVKTAEYSDPRAEEFVWEALRHRRDRIAEAYFGKLMPLDNFTIQGNTLAWDDLLARYRMGDAADVSVEWFRFNNRNRRSESLKTCGRVLPEVQSEYLRAELTSAAWREQRIDVYVRKTVKPEVVGVERFWPKEPGEVNKAGDVLAARGCPFQPGVADE